MATKLGLGDVRYIAEDIGLGECLCSKWPDDEGIRSKDIRHERLRAAWIRAQEAIAEIESILWPGGEG